MATPSYPPNKMYDYSDVLLYQSINERNDQNSPNEISLQETSEKNNQVQDIVEPRKGLQRPQGF